QLVVRRKELEAQIEAIDAQSEYSGPLVFRSYARADEEKARILYNELRKLGFTPWLDKEDLVPGQEWASEIRQIVQKADIFLLCLSKTFAARGYRQVEVKMALDTAEEMPDDTIFIVPVRLEDCEPPEAIRKYHYFDFFSAADLSRTDRAL